MLQDFSVGFTGVVGGKYAGVELAVFESAKLLPLLMVLGVVLRLIFGNCELCIGGV